MASTALPQTAEAAESSEAPRVSYLVYRVERRLRMRLDRAFTPHGVTTTEYVTLSVLRDQDGLSSAQLARLAFVTPQAMNLVISALERRQLVERKPDPGHGRVLRASVTSSGRAALELCDREMDLIEAEMLGDLDPDTVHAVRSALRGFSRALEASAQRSGPGRERNGAKSRAPAADGAG